jgi:HK97 family phage prohead protease
VTIEYRHIALEDMECRFLDGEDMTGTFAGYGSIFGVTDSYGTRMMPGCFRSGGLDEKRYALLWMHDAEHPIGTFTAREDEKGLFIEGRFDPTTEGQDARVRAMSGSAPELSVGFVRIQNQEDDETAIIRAQLVEVSLITARMAATPGAELVAVRSAVEALAPEVPESVRSVLRTRLRLRSV